MYTERHILDNMPPELLDAYLERGWYRLGKYIFTCRFLIFDSQLYSSLWIRLPLENFQFRKRQRKLLRKNKPLFRVVTRPAILSKEKDDLFQIWRKKFPKRQATSLKTSLQDDKEHNIYNTWEVCIYDGEKLIGYSFFDVGKKSIESIKGVYHPDYQEFSLGYYTMLLEIEFALNRGLDFYYPGYIVPGFPTFDYKLRIGDCEFFDSYTKDWSPYAQFERSALPAEKMLYHLRELEGLFQIAKLPAQLYLYPPYETVVFGMEEQGYLEYPAFLSCFHGMFLNNFLAIIYDPDRAVYEMIICYDAGGITEEFPQEMHENAIPFSPNLMVMSQIIPLGKTPQEALLYIVHWLRENYIF